MDTRIRAALSISVGMLAWSGALADGIPDPGRVEAYWPERQWVFVADGRSGAVQGVAIRNGLTPLATLRHPDRSSVRGMLLEPASGRLWVLGPRALDMHDATTGRLLARWKAPDGLVLERLSARPSGLGGPAVEAGRRSFLPLPGMPVLALVPPGG